MRQGSGQSCWAHARRKFHEALQTRQTLATGPLKGHRRQQLGGIPILEARDLNHVIQLISQLPGFKYGLGPIEIRPAADLNEMMKASEQRRRQNTAR